MDIIDEHIKNLIITIVKEIKSRNVNMVVLCNRLNISFSEFMDLIDSPIKDVTTYINILEEVRNEKN